MVVVYFLQCYRFKHWLRRGWEGSRLLGNGDGRFLEGDVGMGKKWLTSPVQAKMKQDRGLKSYLDGQWVGCFSDLEPWQETQFRRQDPLRWCFLKIIFSRWNNAQSTSLARSRCSLALYKWTSAVQTCCLITWEGRRGNLFCIYLVWQQWGGRLLSKL